MRLILASQSEHRKRGLNLLGLNYEIFPSHFDEKSIRDPDPFKLAKKLSEAKALTIGKIIPDAVIIASDAFVVHKGTIMEKPYSLDEALSMIQSLSGQNYEFITGLAVLNSQSNKILSTVEACSIKFRMLQDREIKDYISRSTVMKFAGGHDTDGVLRFAETINGNYNFGAGLPMNRLVEYLRELGVSV